LIDSIGTIDSFLAPFHAPLLDQPGVITEAHLMEFAMAGSDSRKEWIPPDCDPLAKLYVYPWPLPRYWREPRSTSRV